MTTPTESESESESERLSTGSYVRLTVLNRVSLFGVALALAGVLTTVFTAPGGLFPSESPVLGGGLLLAGVVVFAVGFTLGQRTLGDRDDW